MPNQNIYSYSSPKSGNEETGFFNIKGRITRSSFFLRFFFAIGLFVFSAVLYFRGSFGEQGSRSFIFFETLIFYFLPFLISIFILIQGAKRMHDINRSGWFFLIPIYNIFLIFISGDKKNNNYGIDPKPQKKIEYFDEIEPLPEKVVTPLGVDISQLSGLDKWRAHLNQVKERNPNLPYQEVLAIAKKTYKSASTFSVETEVATPKKASKNYFIKFLGVALCLFFGLTYYFNEYEPKHRDSDSDGTPDWLDNCPYEYGVNSGCPDKDGDGIIDSNDKCPDEYGVNSGCPDKDSDGIVDSNDKCPEQPGNASDGCFHYKQVTFSNNSSKKAYLSIAYKNNSEWICEGWFTIEANAQFKYDLPEFFDGKQVFWYVDNDNGEEWSGTDRYFDVEKGGTSGFKVKSGKFLQKVNGWIESKGFYKLDLQGENTDQGFRD